MPTLSFKFALTCTDPDTVLYAVGDVSSTVGGVVSTPVTFTQTLAALFVSLSSGTLGVYSMLNPTAYVPGCCHTFVAVIMHVWLAARPFGRFAHDPLPCPVTVKSGVKFVPAPMFFAWNVATWVCPYLLILWCGYYGCFEISDSWIH